ncbi:GNAT family N-acetyltransferase [Anaerococcus sp. mt242]|uniref:aminoglycoside 6'-N-acetyltransferase n=1 Tax=Anaerococcus sp. mt242 TaxID=2661917 RepID=UPI001931EBE7|nr:aminoglycoside 6'-N-acetyltransferase [Anaerococcus sp. mt242]MBM0046033.1 GNAT family N-acetyltransferase [Anaerococcus sp. mt242]
MIRQASKEDAGILAKMAVKIWDNNSADDLVREFCEMTDDPNSICFIKYSDNLPVAFANASLRYDYVEGTESTPVGYLEGIFVEKGYRKQNIARELVKTCESWAKDMGCKEFASDCELTNLDSLAFHLAIGFSEANRIICFKKNI